MAKIKFNSGPIKKIKDKKKSISDKLKGHGKDLFDSNYENIAYKIPSKWINKLVTYPYIYDTSDLPDNFNIDLSQYSSTLASKRKTLIGIQFDFKNLPSDDPQPLTNIEVWQVYYFPNEKFYYKHKTLNTYSKQDPNYIMDQLDLETTYPINSISLQNAQDISHFELDDNTSGSTFDNYTRLDYFDKEIGFVFFSTDQLVILSQENNTLIISGCQINFGKKLAHKNAIPEKFQKSFFSLKIEADKILTSNSGSGETQTEETEYSDSAVGHPCPPVWQTRKAMEDQANGKNGENFTNNELIAIRSNWQNHYYQAKPIVINNSNNTTKG